MNKLLLTLVGLAAGLTALGQGQININNNFTVPGAAAKAFVLGVDGLPLPKATGWVQVLDSTGNIINGPADGTGKALGADGLFFLGVTTVPNIPIGGNGSVVIQAWDGAAGTTYANAVDKAFVIVTVTALGGGAIPPPGFASNSNWTGLQLNGIPEPSTMALAALGVAGLFFVVRRK